jgi:hypothetical protein
VIDHEAAILFRKPCCTSFHPLFPSADRQRKHAGIRAAFPAQKMIRPERGGQFPALPFQDFERIREKISSMEPLSAVPHALFSWNPLDSIAAC